MENKARNGLILGTIVLLLGLSSVGIAIYQEIENSFPTFWGKTYCTVNGIEFKERKNEARCSLFPIFSDAYITYSFEVDRTRYISISILKSISEKEKVVLSKSTNAKSIVFYDRNNPEKSKIIDVYYPIYKSGYVYFGIFVILLSISIFIVDKRTRNKDRKDKK
jgi:hypothetical protein